MELEVGGMNMNDLDLVSYVFLSEKCNHKNESSYQVHFNKHESPNRVPSTVKMEEEKKRIAKPGEKQIKPKASGSSIYQVCRSLTNFHSS